VLRLARVVFAVEYISKIFKGLCSETYTSNLKSIALTNSEL